MTSTVFKEFRSKFWACLSKIHQPNCTDSSFSWCMCSPFPCQSRHPINPHLTEFVSVQFPQTINWLNLLKDEMLNLQLIVIPLLKLSLVSLLWKTRLSLLLLPFKFLHSLSLQGLPAVHITHWPVLEILLPHNSAMKKQISHLWHPTPCASLA